MNTTLVGQEIHLLRLLGRGGMGTVWLARRWGVLVAVKVMLPLLAREPLAVARFEREVRILGALKAKHTVRLIAAGTHQGSRYAVMENVVGASLHDRLRTNGTPPRAVAFRIVSRLLAALTEVHAEGVVHRDIKPGNIMVCGPDATLDVRLVDFGLASSPTERGASSDKTTVGTGPYMSPEQLFEGGSGSTHEDMWASAVVAYECLVGCAPFDGPSFGAVCVAVNDGVFVPPSAACPDLSPALDAWFARAFARKLADRFPTVVELAAEWEKAGCARWDDAPPRAWAQESTADLTAPILLTRRISNATQALAATA